MPLDLIMFVNQDFIQLIADSSIQKNRILIIVLTNLKHECGDSINLCFVLVTYAVIFFFAKVWYVRVMINNYKFLACTCKKVQQVLY